jgi:HK97 family phage major capsid protein
MDALEKALVDQGMTADEAFEHLKKLADAKKAAAEGQDVRSSNLRKLVDEIVDSAIGKHTPAGHEIPVPPENILAVPPELAAEMWLAVKVADKPAGQLDAEVLSRAYSDQRGIEYSPALIRKALDTADTSTLVPAVLQRQLYRDVEKDAVMMANFRVMDMPNNPWEMPYQASSLTLYGVDESTSDTSSAVQGSDLTFDKITFNAKKMGARVFWSTELEEDALISVLPVIREDLVRIMRNGWERCFLTGDETTANTNINCVGTAPTTTVAAKDYWLQTDGVVHSCIVSHTGQALDCSGAVIGETVFHNVRQKLGKYGTRPGDLMAVVPRELWYDMILIENMLTPDKYGPNATILVGEVSRLFNVPIVVSDGLPLTDDSGKIDDTPGNNVHKSFMMINRPYGVIIGRRGDMRMAQEQVIDTDQTKAVIFSRYDIQYPFWGALAYGYNIT